MLFTGGIFALLVISFVLERKTKDVYFNHKETEDDWDFWRSTKKAGLIFDALQQIVSKPCKGLFNANGAARDFEPHELRSQTRTVNVRQFATPALGIILQHFVFS